MKPKKLLILFLVVLFIVLECTVLNYLEILKVKPDTLLILIIFFSLYYGRTYGLGVGALCGLFKEATCGISYGAFVFVYSLGGLILGHFSRLVYRQKVFGQICISFGFSLLIYFSLFCLFLTYNVNLPSFNSLISVILSVSVYTALITPALFHFLKTVLNVRQ